MGEETFHIAFASRRFSPSDGKRGPTERECLAVLWAVGHFRTYLAGRRFTLVTDYAALTWLFKSRDLSPKLHRWALQLMEYDFVLQWKPGLLHRAPDAFSRLPPAEENPPDIDTSFPGDQPGKAADYVGPRGPVLEGDILDESYPAGIGDDGKSRTLPLAALFMDVAEGRAAALKSDTQGGYETHLTLEDPPFAECAVIDPTGPRRSGRKKIPSVRLKPIEDTLARRVITTAPSRMATTGSRDLDSVLRAGAAANPESETSSGGNDVRGSNTDAIIDRALRSISDFELLRNLQERDHIFGRVRSQLLQDDEEEEAVRVREIYVPDDSDLLGHVSSEGKQQGRLAIPRALVPEMLSLVHAMHGHPGIGATLILLRERFFWHAMTRDVRECVLSCKCRRRKRPHSQQIAMLPGRAISPWEVLEMDLMRAGTVSNTGNKYLLLVVDKTSKFPFAYPLPAKQAEGVAQNLMQLCPTFGVPKAIRCDGGGEFEARCIRNLCKWLRADIQYGPADHPRDQGSVERLGGWMQDVLSELCASWPERWDEYAAPICWVKRTLPDPNLPNKMSPFEILFAPKPRTTLDTLVPQMGGADTAEGLDGFVEQRRQVLGEVKSAPEKRHENKVAAREKRNAKMSRVSAGVQAQPGNLVLVREADSMIYRNGRGDKLEHERWTGPWEVKKVLLEGLIVEVEMQGRQLRRRRVFTALVKPFHQRPDDLTHPIADEFAQQVWTADLGLPQPSKAARPLYTLANRRRALEGAGRAKWEYTGKYQDGTESEWLPEKEVLDSFSPLQLDVFHALWNLYHKDSLKASPSPPHKLRRLNRDEALQVYPIGTRGSMPLGNQELEGQVYGYLDNKWRVRYRDNRWQELTRRQMDRFVKKALGS